MSPHLRILHVIPALQVGGAEMCLVRYLESVANPQDHAVLSLRGEGALGGRLRALGVPLLCARLDSLWGITSMSSNLQKVATFAPDVILGWMYQGNLAATAVAATFSPAVPVVWSIHASLHDFDTISPRSRCAIRASRMLSSVPAKTIYAGTESRRQHLRFGFQSADRALTIPNGVDVSSFAFSSAARQAIRDELGLADTTPLIGSVGRYDRVKGYPVFIEAAAKVQRRYPDAHFCLVGAGLNDANHDLSRLLTRNNLSKSFHLMGPRADVSNIYSSFDIFTLSSHSEALPMVLLEAMAAARPSVVTDVGDCRAMLGKSGIVVPTNDPGAMCEAWCQLLSEPELALMERGRALQARVSTRYSHEAFAAQYEEVFRASVQAASENHSTEVSSL